MSATTAQNAIAVVGIDIGKNSFHIVGLDDRGAIVLRQKWSRSQVEAGFAHMPPCLIGIEASSSAPPKSETQSFRPRCQADAGKVRAAIFQGAEDDFRDAEAIAEAVQRPTMRFVTTKSADQLDLQAPHRVRERWSANALASSIKSRLLAGARHRMRQGQRFLRTELPAFSPRRPTCSQPAWCALSKV